MVVVTAGLATAVPETAPLALPCVVGLAVVGLCLLPRHLTRQDARSALLVGVVVFVSFGAPVLLSGHPTFAGYVKLDDTATFLAFADHVLDHGRDLSELGPSTHEATLAVNVANGYPLGGILPLAIGSRLVGSDPAWIWQPFISFAAALLAMSLYAIARRILPSDGRAAAAALLGSQSALLYGFAQWGGVKEVVAAALLVLGAAALDGPALRARAGLVPAMSFAAFLDVMSLAGAAWLVPLGLVAALAARRAHLVRRALVLCALTATLSVPALVEADRFLRRDNISSFRAGEELGNLVRPLPVRQVLGIWPTADFRVDPVHRRETAALLVVSLAAILLGLALSLRRRSRAVLALSASCGACVTLFVLAGSPWVGGKALAVASPAVLFVAAVGVLGLLAHRRWLALGVGGLVVTGVAWSNVLAYRGVWLAPFEQLRELERIGRRFAGQGPALMTEYQPYGARHFLRSLDAEGASELRRRTVPLATGALLPKGAYADLDEFDLAEIGRSYPLLVLRRAPVSSRPPARYALVQRGQWYDVWQRDPATEVVRHEALGGALDPAAPAACEVARAMGRSAVAGGGMLATPAARVVAVVGLGGDLPAGWLPAGAGSGLADARSSGSATIAVTVPESGLFGLWVGGSMRGRLTATIDGNSVGALPGHLNPAGMWMLLGSARLAAGSHRVELTVERSSWRPGETGSGFLLGPVALAQEAVGPLETLPGGQSGAVCAVPQDWVEVIVGRPG